MEKVEIKEAEAGFESLGKEVKKAAGGGKLVLFAEEGRSAEDAAAALGVEGFRVLKTLVDQDAFSRYSLLNEKSYPECVSAVVGVGSAAAMDCAKAFRKSRALVCVLFPTDLSALNALQEASYFRTTGGLARFPAQDRIVLIDKKRILASPASSGIGLFLSRFVSIFDGAYEALLKKGASPAVSLSTLRECARELLGITEEDAAEKIFRAILALEEAIREKNLPESPSSETLAALLCRESERAYSEERFVAAYSLLRLYSYYLSAIPLDHAVPPDRAKNIEILRSECGVCASALLSREDQTFSEGAEDRLFLTAEYKEDFLSLLKESVLPLSALCRAFRRLAKKEGAGESLSADRILTLVSLTGELVSGYPLIKQIKTTGLIEPLLSCG
ncbi:MAG: hypothetical protein K5753_06595 [Clostridia bacterium]|nr:hypothetical protein [Clostridia bacterium]